MLTTIQKWGNSQGIRIPKHILDNMKWKTNEELEIKESQGKLIVQKAVSKRKTIQELFKDYDGPYEQTEFDWGDTVGHEIW